MKKVTIDASTILTGRKIDGLARTTGGLIEAFSMMHLPFEIKLFAQRLRGQRIKRFNYKTCHLRLPGWKIFSFLTSHLPVIETICGSDLYHIPHNYAPLYRLEEMLENFYLEMIKGSI